MFEYEEDHQGECVENQDNQSVAQSEVTFANVPQDFELFRGVPAFETYLKKRMGEDRVDQHSPKLKHRKTGMSMTEENREGMQPTETPKSTRGEGAQGRMQSAGIVKSPSDTTIYVPAFNAQLCNWLTQDNNQVLQDHLVANTNRVQAMEISNMTQPNGVQHEQSVDVINQIAKFIEGIRTGQEAIQPSTSAAPCAAVGGGDVEKSQLDLARERSSKMVVEAEQFWVSVNAPGNINICDMQLNKAYDHSNQIGTAHGTVNPIVVNKGLDMETVHQIGGLDVDDQFFHVTCHIEDSLREKIQQGEFVDLEKLLPKHSRGSLNDNKMDLIYKDGHSYFVLAQNDNKINGVRRW